MQIERRIDFWEERSIGMHDRDRCVTVWLLLSMLFLLLCSTPSFAQLRSPVFVPIAPEVLSNSHVRCFYKDSKGYMWIGTEDALIRYDVGALIGM